MRAWGFVVALVAGCSFVTSEGPRGPARCKPVDRAVTLDAIGSVAFGLALVAGAIDDRSNREFSGFAEGAAAISAITATAYLAASIYGYHHRKQCNSTLAASVAEDAKQRTIDERDRAERDAAARACRVTRDEELRDVRTIPEHAQRKHGVDALSRCEAIDGIERVGDLLVAATRAAIDHDCARAVALVARVRESDARYGADIDRDLDLRACLVEARITRETRERTVTLCRVQRADQLRKAQSLPPDDRARALIAIPSCE
jgi:hypothetical protein